METCVGQISILRDIEKRAQARPCTFGDLVGLERDLKECVVALRQEREAQREKEVIAPEPPDLRKAIEAARGAIRRAKADHEIARREVTRLEDMVRRGHVHEAVK